jgi:DNA-directed RNA polymerase specialized sigma24 family protein
VGKSQANYNTKTQVRALEVLISKLPSPSDPLPPPRARNPQRRAKQLKEDEAREIVAEYKAGATVYQLGQRFGINRQTVSKILKRYGIKMRMGGLTPDQVDEAVQLYEGGWSLARIGKRMGVNDNTVRSRLLERGVRMRPRRGGKHSKTAQT